ncbi:MAG: hypothetical protein K0S55_1608 [Clostridia bacterium]|nr:hypothetical protein [Clostridia bacterium]
MRKFIVLLFLSIFLLNACGTGQENIDGENPVEEIKDMNGTHFVFMTYWTMEYLPEAGRSLLADKVRERYAEVNEKYNCNFEVVHGDNTISFLTTALSAATDVPDIVQLHSHEIYPFYQQGVLLALEDIATIDSNDDKWGYKHYIQYGVFDEKTYGFFPNEWMIMPECTGIMTFNNEYLKSIGLDKEPYKLQEAGNWNWDTFLELIKTCTFNTGEEKMTGFGSENTSFTSKAAIFSNGGEIVTQKDGKYVLSLGEPNAIAALEWLANLKSDGYMIAADYPLFVDKSVAFWCCDSWKATIDYEGHEAYPAFKMEDYGIIDFPTGPSGSTEKTSAYVHFNRKLSWPIAYSENDKDDLGTVMNAVFEPLPDSEEKGWMKLSERTIFHHDEGYLNFQKMIETARYDYSVQLKDVTARIDTALTSINSKKKTAIAGISEISDLITVEIDENLNNIKD